MCWPHLDFETLSCVERILLSDAMYFRRDNFRLRRCRALLMRKTTTPMNRHPHLGRGLCFSINRAAVDSPIRPRDQDTPHRDFIRCRYLPSLNVHVLSFRCRNSTGSWRVCLADQHDNKYIPGSQPRACSCWQLWLRTRGEILTWLSDLPGHLPNHLRHPCRHIRPPPHLSRLFCHILLRQRGTGSAGKLCLLAHLTQSAERW